MNEEKKRWVVTLGVGALLAIGLGVLIYFQKEDIEKARQEAAGLRSTIEQHRTLIKKTPELVKRVIVQRETDAVIEEILSSERDVLDFSRTLYKFASDTGVTIKDLKPIQDRSAVGRGRKPEFARVGYSINFEGDGFHLLAFLNRVESHPRFMSVPQFKLQAASRNDYDSEEEPRHRIQMDVETYVYTPTSSINQVRIDHYDRKKELLISEISKRESEIRFQPYEYRGPRGRRDPWIDPRISIVEDEVQVPIEEQLELVTELVDRAHAAELLWTEVQNAENVIKEMRARASLEEELAALQSEILKLQDEGILTYVLAEKRFENQVVSLVNRLVEESTAPDASPGPSLAVLTETYDIMDSHVSRHEYERAIEAFQTLDGRLEEIEGEERIAMVQALEDLKRVADTVLAFEGIPLEINGVAMHEGYRPVALINGSATSEGDLVGDELIVRRISTEQIEFAFRGLVLARIVHSSPQ